MPFSKSTQRLGGKAPASSLQKIRARQTIGKTQPWKRSTGAKTPLGTARSGQNAFKASHRWRLHSTDPQFHNKIQLIKGAIDCLLQLQRQYGCELSNGYFRIVVKESTKRGRDGLESWQSIALRISCESSVWYVGREGELMPDSAAIQQGQIQTAHDAVKPEIERIQAILRLVENSPVAPAIEVTAKAEISNL